MQYSTKYFRQVRRKIGRKIHAIRMNQKITLKRLSSETGLPEDLIDQYELRKSEIRLNALLKIACAFRMDVSVFF